MLTPGIVLAGRYRVGEEIGAGGMGVVYEATLVELNRRVAIKVLPQELAAEPLFVERFRREAETAASLGSPHIVQVTDFVRSDQATFLVMERLVGQSLLEVLQEQQLLDVSIAVDVTSQLLGALAVAHQAGVVHRDLKPGNVFLVSLAGGKTLVKLLDFGIARLMESQGYTRLTSTGVIVGTPRYASPEQVSGRPVDARSDLFSVGVLLYGMITGRPPFVKEGAALAVEIMKSEPPDPRSLKATVTQGMAEFLWKALRKDPEQRFQSAAEMGRALAQLGGAAWTTRVDDAAMLAPVLERTGEVSHRPRIPTDGGHRPLGVGEVPRTPPSGTPMQYGEASGPVPRTPWSTPVRPRIDVPETSTQVPTHPARSNAQPARSNARTGILIVLAVVVFLLGSAAAGIAIALTLGAPPGMAPVEGNADPELPASCRSWESLVCSPDDGAEACRTAREANAEYRASLRRDPNDRAFIRGECERSHAAARAARGDTVAP